MKHVMIFASLLTLSACSYHNAKFDRSKNKDLYKLQFISSYLNRYKNDSIWKDAIPCYIPSNLDNQAIREIDSLVNESFSKLWERSDQGREFVGSREGLVLDSECVTDELLIMLNSNNLNKFAKNYESRLKKK